MATVPYTILPDDRHGIYCILVRWVLGPNDDGRPFDGIDYPDKTVQVTGTFGGSVTIQGSNELPTPSAWFTLTDPQGNPIVMTAAGGEAISENPYWIRPVAGTVTSVTVTLSCAQSRR